MKLAILSDIHSNAHALAAALQQIENMAIDQVVCLGDLLTYGCEPNKVIELLQDCQSQYPTVFIKGNHDQCYFDHENQTTSDYELPGFIRESFDWTMATLQYSLSTTFLWHEQAIIENILFRHANPYAYQDWTYLNNDEALQQAAIEVNKQGHQIACFGHTHRHFITSICSQTLQHHDAPMLFSKPIKQTILLNPGSLGQPRGAGSSFFTIDTNAETIHIKQHTVNYSLTDYLNTIYQAQLSEQTTTKLCAFFKAVND